MCLCLLHSGSKGGGSAPNRCRFKTKKKCCVVVTLPACTANMSVIWKFFEICETDVTHASCNACKRLVPRGGNKPSSFNTTNLIRHLKSFHSKEHNDFLQLTSEKKKTTPTPQALLQTTLESTQPYNPRGEKAMGITRRLYSLYRLNLYFIFLYYVCNNTAI